MAVIFMLSTNGYLSQHGYVDVKKKTKLSRHRSLMRVFRSGESPLRLFRRLHALVILFKNKDPKTYLLESLKNYSRKILSSVRAPRNGIMIKYNSKKHNNMKI